VKIPTLFIRDHQDRRFVVPIVTKDCEWVIAGEGVATRQYDGVHVLYDPGVNLELAPEPELAGWFVEDRRGELVEGWQSKYAGPLREAIAALPASDAALPGTHELIGRKINRDPEKVGRHLLIAHRDADRLPDAPRTFEGLRRWLAEHNYEGIVWHWEQPDGSVKMAKLKRKDMRR
jgi:hypothetical protein